MYNSNKTIVEHFPGFLAYCDAGGLTRITQENYKRYLKKFLDWLYYKNLGKIFPNELNENHVVEYKNYLLSPTINRNTGKTLKPNTQSYYLIALRAFLGYFSAKGIVSLAPNKITLPKVNKCLENERNLDKTAIKAILNAPSDDNIIGLRDRAILDVIISTGFKVRSICSLNRNYLQNIPEDTIPCLKKYLDKRTDNEDALFINYRGANGADRRLTSRSVEKIVRRYTEDVGLSTPLTPELLRSAKILSVWAEEVEIKNTIWSETENQINKKIFWLRKNISTLPEAYKSRAFLASLIKCENCIFRKIAILIISNRVRQSELSLTNFLGSKFSSVNTSVSGHHGSDWHKKMMDRVANSSLFKQKHKIVREPATNYGRADLSYFPDKGKPIYVEVGTVSLFKVWYNLMTMKNCTFILVPNNDVIIKFET
jgi:site-specific recombinase XerD